LYSGVIFQFDEDDAVDYAADDDSDLYDYGIMM
jgi:hypothetical protein